MYLVYIDGINNNVSNPEISWSLGHESFVIGGGGGWGEVESVNHSM
jgi:hypothetical protein